MYTPNSFRNSESYTPCVILIQNKDSTEKITDTSYMLNSGTGEISMEKTIPSFEELTKIMRGTPLNIQPLI